jgi:hypothetical protein
MNHAANEVLGAQVATAVARRTEALEVLRRGAKPLVTVQLVATAASVGIGGAVAGHVQGGANGGLLGFALGVALSLGVGAAIECHQMRKRLEAAITLLLQEVKDVG